MAKIVIDAREYSTSTGRYVAKLIEYLEKIDSENQYIILLRKDDLNKCKLSNPNFSSLVTPYQEFGFSEQLGFAKQLYSLKADLVHFGMVQQPILYFKRTVTTIHDLTTLRFINPSKNPVVFRIKQLVYALVMWIAAHKSKIVITPSSYVKKDLLQYTAIKPDKIIVTPESADHIKDIPEPIKRLVGKSFIMYVGRPTPHKNLWRLIQAFHEAQNQHPELILALAGKLDANYRAIQKRVKQEGIDGVYFCGFVSEGQLRWLYENCQAYMFASLSEGFGLPGLEAMAHGAPVLSSNATCLPEVYGNAVLYFDPLSVQEMTAAINKILVDQHLRQQLVVLGKDRLKHFSWEKMAQITLDAYKKALS